MYCLANKKLIKISQITFSRAIKVSMQQSSQQYFSADAVYDGAYTSLLHACPVKTNLKPLRHVHIIAT